VRPRRVVLNVVALVVFAFSVFPVYWMVTAFKPTKDIQAETPSFFPTHVTLSHFGTAVHAEGFWLFWRNSAFVAVSGVLLALVVACLAAFAVARLKWKGRQAFVVMVFVAQMTPWEALLIPRYVIARDTDMLNELPMLTLIYFMMTLPFTIVTLRGFLNAIPADLEEAAKVDGCNQFQAFRRIVSRCSRRDCCPRRCWGSSRPGTSSRSRTC